MKKHFNFIEIGTSDFHTLIEQSTDNTVGLSIEPIEYYLNRLPNKKNVKKINAAVSNENGEIEIYLIEPEDIIKNNLPIWVKGCNSVNKPHEFTRNKLGPDFYDSIVKIKKVPTIDWNTIINENEVKSVGYVKIDTEGYDHVILKNYFEYCEKNPSLYANKIMFEYNESSNKEELEKLIKNLPNYTIERLEEDIVLHKVSGLFYKGKKIADRGCVINLPERNDRRINIEKTLTELNFSGFEFVDGVVMENEEYKKLGCTQAYMNIFQDFLDSDMQNILIFEDDLKLMDGVTEKQLDKIFDNWHESVERYDVLALGIKLLPRSKIYPNSETDGSFKEMLCSQSLFYKRNFIEHYVDQMKNYLDPSHYLYKCTIDMFLNDSTNSQFRFRHGAGHKVFDFGITIPMIFTQTLSYSDNENKIQNYDSIMKDVFWKSLVHQRGYVYLANEKYFDIVQTSARSVREFSKYPIFVYMLNSDKKVNVENTTTIRWDVNLPKSSEPMYNSDGENFYIDRSNSTIYNILIQRINAVKHALENFVQTAVYIDSDSIATPYIDSIFDMYNEETTYPFFVEGIYDWMFLNGRGGAESMDDLSNTLEAPACELFNIDQYVRQKYRQTGYFVAGQKSLDFLEEWYWYCTHPKVLKNTSWYAAYNEETIMNVLTYKHKIFDGLPYIYVNGGPEIVDKMYTEVEFLGEDVRNHLGNWLRAPESKEKILFFHGEKRIDKMEKMIEKIKGYFEYDIKPPKNWGDIISHKVIQHFSGQKIYSSDVFHFDPDARVPFLEGKLLAAGSILMYSLPTDYVWGSGCIKENEVGLPPKKYYAVRGPLTRNELLKVNRECPEVYGDPGLLFPRIYNPDIEKKYKYGVIPHYIDFRHPETLKCLKKLKEMGAKIINITAGLYEFVDQLKEVEFVISSSLHGLIAADAYGIPNSRIYFSNNINGGDFKYMDYYYSVNRHYETPKTITYENAEQLINELVFDLGDTSIADKLLESAPWNDPSCILFNSNKKMRLLFVAPHLSTGGMPGFLLKKIQLLKQYYPEIKIYVVEYQSYGDAYVVQRNQIIDIVDRGNFWTLGPDKSELIRIIKSNEIDIVHVQEMIEGFDSFNQMPPEIMSQLYSNDRTWKMVETCHNVWFNHEEHKIFYPEAFAFCTPYHKDVTFKNVPSYSENIEFPIEKKIFTEEERIAARRELGFGKDKIHVINVGLWTKGKNQGEGVEIARLLRKTNPEIVFHFIGNQASNFKDYWGPIMKNLPMNVKVWGERADVDTFMKAADVFMFNSTWECNPLVLREAISYGLKVLCRNLPQYMDMFTPYIEPIDENIETTKEKLLSLIKEDVKYKTPQGQEEIFASKYSDFYKKVLDLPVREQYFKTKLSVTQYFINQPFIEIKGKSENKFKIQFFDEKGVLHYENHLAINSWVKLNRQYFTRWTTKVWENDNLVYENTLNYEGKRVYIAFDSKSLGDTISWVPYAEEFRKVHNCEVVVSTFWNHLFESVYPDLKFVHPGTTVNGIHGMYKLGWFYNVDMQPTKPNLIPLQQTATDILGLEYKEIQPKIHYEIKERPYAEKYVTIATNSTAGCKFWTREGWQETINYLTSLGYKVVNVSKENNPFENQIRITDTSMENTMNVIHHSEFFIGLSSGLSWLAWGMGKHVVMISNFTTPDHEFQSNCTRIINLSVCNGCWNKPEFTFDKGDWDWCPVHKGTERHFECHKSITSDMLIKQIQHLL